MSTSALASSRLETLVDQLRKQTDCDRPRALEVIRANYPELSGEIDAGVQAEREREDKLEKQEQVEIRKLFIAMGGKVYNLSQARAAKQSPGLGDLWVVFRSRAVAFWWESKRQIGGARSEAQVDFGDECEACDVGYGFGDRWAAGRYLVRLGICTFSPGSPCGVELKR